MSVSSPNPLTYGAYRLTFGLLRTGCINWYATAAHLEAELEKLATIDSVYVVREGDATGSPSVPQFGYKYTIFFDGNVVRGNVGLLVSSLGAAQAPLGPCKIGRAHV